MKRILSALLVLGVVLFFVTAFIWEGELDPNEFEKWEVISATPSGSNLMLIIIHNPDSASPIHKVAMLVDYSSNLLAYRYFKDGEPFGYFFDTAQEKYVRHEYTSEEKKGCMGCHKDQAKVNKSI